MKRLAVLAMLVLLVLLAHTAATAPTAPKPEPPPSWTADLSAAGFGKITFVQWPADWRGARNVDLRGVWIRSRGVCEIHYNPALEGRPLEEAGNRSLSFRRWMWFSSGLLTCGLFLPENEELRKALHERGITPPLEEWLKKYQESCKATSFFRLGWKWDPETDTDLACVPDWREVIEAHLSVTPQNTALAL